jgi:hypothetical protein
MFEGAAAVRFAAAILDQYHRPLGWIEFPQAKSLIRARHSRAIACFHSGRGTPRRERRAINHIGRRLNASTRRSPWSSALLEFRLRACHPQYSVWREDSACIGRPDLNPQAMTPH